MEVTEPCVSLRPAGQPTFFHTAAGQASKRTDESVQDVLRLRLRTGTGTIYHILLAKAGHKATPRCKGMGRSSEAVLRGAQSRRSGELRPIAQSAIDRCWCYRRVTYEKTETWEFPLRFRGNKAKKHPRGYGFEPSPCSVD